MDEDINNQQMLLQQASIDLLEQTPLLSFLKQLGEPVQTGSSITGLMVYPDIDFTVQNANPNIQVAIDLVPIIFKELGATEVKIADFQPLDNESPVYYLGITFPFNGLSWHIDSTITYPGPVVSNPPEIDEWIKNITPQERNAILELKKKLIDSNRYVGARSQPPFTFRSVHLYEGVIKGKARSVKELEEYFK
jgi:hypothetical protein